MYVARNAYLREILLVRNEKTTLKSWPTNHLQVSNLTFDPCFKVKFGHHTKKALYLPYYWF